MFRYSNDEFIAGKQLEEATTLLIEMSKISSLEYCPEIEDEIPKKISYPYFTEFVKMVKNCGDRIALPFIPRTRKNYDHATKDLYLALDACNKSKKDIIPYIELSFPSDYKCPHGDEYKHTFVFFVTNYVTFEESRDISVHYLKKFNNLKVFV